MKAWRILAVILTAFIGATGETPAFGEWPERALTLIGPLPHELPWGAPNPQAALLGALAPRLSRELGVPVNYVVQAEGEGVLAANSTALARDDGYVIAALGNDPAINMVIQGYTPYVWGEMTPAATLWRTVYVIAAATDLPAADLRGLAEVAAKVPARGGSQEGWPRLARLAPGPISSAELMAMEAARSAGFAWRLVETDNPNPEVLLAGLAEAAVLPLADFMTHPRRDEFKVLLVLSAEPPRGAEGWPNLKSQSLTTTTNTFFTLYLPSKINWRARIRLGVAVNNALRVKAVAERLVEFGLLPYLEDPEAIASVLNLEYENQTKLLKSFGLIESASEAAD